MTLVIKTKENYNFVHWQEEENKPQEIKESVAQLQFFLGN